MRDCMRKCRKPSCIGKQHKNVNVPAQRSVAVRICLCEYGITGEMPCSSSFLPAAVGGSTG